MHACDYIPFQWAKEKKNKAHKQRLVSINLEPNFSTIPNYVAKCHSKYNIYTTFVFKILLLFIVQFKAHGKVALKTIVIIIM
jgi:hypothetical protein